MRLAFVDSEGKDSLVPDVSERLSYPSGDGDYDYDSPVKASIIDVCIVLVSIRYNTMSKTNSLEK